MTKVRLHNARRMLRPFQKFRLHPLFLVLVVLAVGLGMWKDVVVLFLIVFLHEMGHAMVAEYLGYEVEVVSLLPFGGVARLSRGQLGFIPKHESLIAVAGPLVNLLLALFSWFLAASHLISESFFHTSLQLNLWIALFNLLPALPLDGGRVLRAARSRTVGYELATREGYRLAYVISILLLVLGSAALWAGSPHVGIVILGVFLFVSAFTGSRDVSMDTVRFLDSKRKKSSRGPEEIKALAAPAQTTIKSVVRQFSPDCYHMVYVLNQDGSVVTLLEEDELLDAVFQGEWLLPLSSFLK